VRTLAQLFRDAPHIKLRLVGIGGGEEDLSWLRAVDHAILLPDSRESSKPWEQPEENPIRTRTIVMGDLPGAPGWNKAILDIIS
jgi:hypothetical protein